MRYPSGPLRERNFLFLFIGQSVSDLGNAAHRAVTRSAMAPSGSDAAMAAAIGRPACLNEGSVRTLRTAACIA
jgi:hypothetical protein